MAMPNESSLFCSECGCYNIQCGDCIILNGKAICYDCIDILHGRTKFQELRKILNQRRRRTNDK